MNFGQALELLKSEKMVRRQCWQDSMLKLLGYVDSKRFPRFVMWDAGYRRWNQYLPTTTDVVAEDWVECDENE